VVWDMTIMSHGGHGRKGLAVDRAVEVIIYQDEEGEANEDAITTIITWLKSSNLKYNISDGILGL
jgi:hypothetical protein